MNWVPYQLVPYLPLLFKALWVSIYVSVISYVAGLALGLVIYFGKTGRRKVSRTIARGYIELLRNIPLLVVLYLVYFGLGRFGIDINPLWSALIGLTLNCAAFLAEILRAGFASVPVGVREAADALGLSHRQAFRHVVALPGVRSVIPALTNQFILLFLFSSVASIVSLPELTYQLEHVNSETLMTFEVFGLGALMYYVVVMIITGLSRLGEKALFQW
ncbi:MAG: amino acid ABC transporter permease, partial [Micrococcales bacterium]|nr:amino acid ABC transporter permease [Micrococcales bacterium]